MADAGIEEATSVILTTHLDATNIYLAVYSRKLNPETIIVSRINHLKNIEAIHRAGADFAISDPQIRIQSVLSCLAGRAPVILGEGLDLFDIPVSDALASQSLRDSGILTRTGLAVIAIERNGVVDPQPRPEKKLQKGERIVLVGTRADRDAFDAAFGS